MRRRVPRWSGGAVLLGGHRFKEVGHAAELLDDGEQLAAWLFVLATGFVRRGVQESCERFADGEGRHDQRREQLVAFAAALSC
ncbi:MAG: hypothetical protein LC777_21410, partial [Actinobacteria bacterium]|nr:hypothetical protein [Actinomycetota bacterium]